MTSPTQQPNPFSSPIYTHAVQPNQEHAKTRDTLAPGGTDTLAIDAPHAVWDRPTLRSLSPQSPPDVLVSLAAAFAAIFAAQSSSAENSFFQVSQDQELSNIQSSQVLTSTVTAVNKQQQVYNEYEKIAKKANNPVLKYLGWIVLALTVVLIATTIISGLFTGGGSEALVPEEIEMTDMAAGSLSTTETTSEPAILTPELENAMQMTTINSTSTQSEATTATTETSAQAGTQAQRTTIAKLLLWLARFMGAAAGASPMLAQGIVSLKLVPVYRSLANTQRGVGAAMASQSMQQSIFSLLQKCSERDQSVASNETGGTADSSKTFSEIIGLYEQIAQQSKQGLI